MHDDLTPIFFPKFLRQLGLLPTWQFGDVYGMDPELLSMVPRPVCAVLLLFPVTEKVGLLQLLQPNVCLFDLGYLVKRSHSWCRLLFYAKKYTLLS